MKRTFISMLMVFTVILCLVPGVSAHQGFSDSIDFNTYVGDNTTLNVLPPNGSLGTFAFRNCQNGTDGPTSQVVTAERGTSLALHQLNKNSSGLNYNFRNTMYGTVHVKVSIMATAGSQMPSLMVMDTRASGNHLLASLYEGYVRVLGKPVYTGDYPMDLKMNQWYDFDIIYSPTSGYYKATVTSNGVVGRLEGCYATKLLNVNAVQFLNYGGPSASNRVARLTYFDDFSIETVNYVPAQFPVETFDSYVGNAAGITPPEGFVLKNYLGKSVHDIYKSSAAIAANTIPVQNFESYTGNAETLKALPTDPTGNGSWSIHHSDYTYLAGVTNGTGRGGGNAMKMTWGVARPNGLGSSNPYTNMGVTYTLTRPTTKGIELRFSTKFEAYNTNILNFYLQGTKTGSATKQTARIGYIYPHSNGIYFMGKTVNAANGGFPSDMMKDWVDVYLSIDLETGDSVLRLTQFGKPLYETKRDFNAEFPGFETIMGMDFMTTGVSVGSTSQIYFDDFAMYDKGDLVQTRNFDFANAFPAANANLLTAPQGFSLTGAVENVAGASLDNGTVRLVNVAGNAQVVSLARGVPVDATAHSFSMGIKPADTKGADVSITNDTTTYTPASFKNGKILIGGVEKGSFTAGTEYSVLVEVDEADATAEVLVTDGTNVYTGTLNLGSSSYNMASIQIVLPAGTATSSNLTYMNYAPIYEKTTIVPDYDTTGAAYAGAFRKTTDKGASLALSANTDKTVTLSKALPFGVVDSFAFEADVMVQDYNNNRSIVLTGTNASSQATSQTVFTVCKESGNIKLLNTDTGYKMIPTKWHHIRLVFTPANNSARLWVQPEGDIVTELSAYLETASDLKTLTGYDLKIFDFEAFFGKTADILFDNILVTEGEKVYAKRNGYEYALDIADSTPKSGSELAYTPATAHVTFSNPLAANVLETATITLNGTAVSGVVLEDAYTLAVPITASLNKVYHLQFDNIKDIYDNTLSDFVEFNAETTSPTTAIAVGTEFSKETAGGKVILKDITTGTITATITLR